MNREIVLKVAPWLIIIILLAILIFRKPDPKDNSDKERNLKDSLVVLRNQITERDGVITKRNFVIDSLNQIKTSNETVYKTKIRYINLATTSVYELDSIIRASIKD